MSTRRVKGGQGEIPTDFGTAAYLNVGRDHGEIPTNDELGGAAYLEIGLEPLEIPVNQDLGSAAYQARTAFATPAQIAQSIACLLYTSPSPRDS